MNELRYEVTNVTLSKVGGNSQRWLRFLVEKSIKAFRGFRSLGGGLLSFGSRKSKGNQ